MLLFDSMGKAVQQHVINSVGVVTVYFYMSRLIRRPSYKDANICIFIIHLDIWLMRVFTVHCAAWSVFLRRCVNVQFIKGTVS
jgi:hypothetical protein